MTDGALHDAAGRTWAAVLLACLLVVGACAQATPDEPAGEPTTSNSPEADAAPPPNTAEDDMPEQSGAATRLATALDGSDPDLAELVRATGTQVTVLDTEWLTGWQVMDVVNRAPPHPRRFFAALSQADQVAVLTDNPNAFNRFMRGADMSVDTAETATAIATLWLDSTRSFDQWAYRIDSFDDIEWLPNPTEAQAAARDDLETSLADQVAAPSATRDGDAGEWSVTAWLVNGTNLVEATVTVAVDGQVQADQTVRAESIPVPESL